MRPVRLVNNNSLLPHGNLGAPCQDVSQALRSPGIVLCTRPRHPTLQAMSLGLLVVDHGSRRAASNAQLGDMAQRVATLYPDALVDFAHMEIAEPSIDDRFARLVERGATEIRVLLYFLSDGRHVTEDVPELVAAAAAKHPGVTWSVGAALGPDDALAALMLKRAGLEP